MIEKYTFKLYDTPLFSYEFTPDGFNGFAISNIKPLDGRSHLFPLDLDLTPDGILTWLKRRIIPENREFYDVILKTFDLTHNDLKGVIDVSKGLSLNDSYWITPEDFSGSWAECNLYENKHSEILAQVAFTGKSAFDPTFSISPELTTDGMLPKAWRTIDGKGIFLYKRGTFGFANSGNEPYSEFYVSQIARAMGLNAVSYDLENWQGITASKCKLFTDMDTSFLPMGRLAKSGGLKAVLDFYDKQENSDYRDELRDMLVFDALVCNTDRHFGNFGVLRDNKSGAITAPAPVFDNGMALFSYAMPDEIETLEEYAETRTPPYEFETFEQVVSYVITKRQVEKLSKLIGFRFRRHESINLPEKRLLAIEQFLQKRIPQLIALARSKLV